MIPLSGWLSRAFSTRWLFTVSAAGFTISSVVCGFAWDINSMIAWRRNPGLYRRRDDSDRLRHRLRDVHGQETRDGPGGARPAQQSRADAGSDAGRLDHRHALMELALLRQCCAGPRHHLHRPAFRRDRHARFFAAQEVRLRGPVPARARARQPRVRTGGRLPLELARRSDDPQLGVDRRDLKRALPLALPDGREPNRGPAPAQQPHVRDGVALHLHHRLRPLRRHLCAAAFPRPSGGI